MEDLALQVGELGREDSEGGAVDQDRDAFGEAEEAQDVFGGRASAGTRLGV